MDKTVTCEIRYRLDPSRQVEFEAYARIWTMLIERHGGKHHGYFLPREKPDGASLSFAGLGEDGADNIAIALFSFPDEETYLNYRKTVADDPDCLAANRRFGDNPPFSSYERIFLKPLPRGNPE